MNGFDIGRHTIGLEEATESVNALRNEQGKKLMNEAHLKCSPTGAASSDRGERETAAAEAKGLRRLNKDLSLLIVPNLSPSI